ncbi:MAG TPA: acyl carrier protein [Pseudonocardiaceae bacterium]|nr:acyl carrier protein [Pseudonocardiaceae bacterium]
MTHDEIAERLEAFIRTRYSISANDPGFTRDVDLFDLGYVDSIGLVELLTFINASFEVEIKDDDLLSDEFSNIHGMAKIVCRQGEW